MVKPLALTLGEPAGIGPDITLLSWLKRREVALQPFYVVGDASMLARRARVKWGEKGRASGGIPVAASRRTSSACNDTTFAGGELAPSQAMPVLRKHPISSSFSTQGWLRIAAASERSSGTLATGCVPRKASVTWMLSDATARPWDSAATCLASSPMIVRVAASGHKAKKSRSVGTGMSR